MNQNQVETETQNQIEEKKERDSNFELLRIFAMLGIVLHHLIQHGIWFAPNAPVDSAFLISHAGEWWIGQLGNEIFILLSGYFVCTSRFSWKKVFRLWLQIFSISAIIGLVAYFSKIPVITFSQQANADYEQFGFFSVAKPARLVDLIHSFLPCYFGTNWFAAAYLVFYLFVPFLNLFLKHLPKKEHFHLIILMVVLGTVIRMFPFEGFFQTNNLYLFILGYFVASYIRLYNPPILNHTKVNLGIALFCILVLFAGWGTLIRARFMHIPFVKNHYIQVAGYFGAGLTRPPILICAVAILSLFKNLHIPHNRFINTVASTTFGVYLIHENLLINKWWWHAVCKLDDFVSSKWLLPYMLLCAVVTFAICSALELVRKNCIEKPIFAIIFRTQHEK